MAGIGEHCPATEKAVWDREELYWRSLKDRDAETYLSLWDERFVGWPYFVSAPLDKDGVRNQILDANGRWAKSSTVIDYRLEALSVRQYGDEIAIAIYRVTYRVAGTDNSPERDLVNRITHTWQKTGRGWRIIGGMSGLDQQAP